MPKYGTASAKQATVPVCSNGQFATIAGRLTVALPKALEHLASKGVDTRRVINYTDEGELLSRALAIGIMEIYNGSARITPDYWK